MRCRFCIQYREQFWKSVDKFEEAEADEFALWQRETDEQRANFDRICMLHSRDPQAAFDMAKRAADAGSVFAMKTLGYYYDTGFSCSKNFPKAQEYYLGAISAGSWIALLDYARMLEREEHSDLADYYIEQAIEADLAAGHYQKAKFSWNRAPSRQTAERIYPHLALAADKGHRGALLMIARLYLYGWCGLRGRFKGLRAFYRLVASAQ